MREAVSLEEKGEQDAVNCSPDFHDSVVACFTHTEGFKPRHTTAHACNGSIDIESGANVGQSVQAFPPTLESPTPGRSCRLQASSSITQESIVASRRSAIATDIVERMKREQRLSCQQED